jgi:hypothetical protein
MANKPKSLTMDVDGERYRSALSTLLASDGEATFLFRALNSNYFVQKEGKKDTIKVLPQAEAEKLFKKLPARHQSFVSAFPKGNGGVGMDTPSSYDDDDEKDRLREGYGVDPDSAYQDITPAS